MTDDLENYLVRRIRPDEQFRDLIDFPAYFEIETVNTCNARCPMCTIDDWDRHSPIIKDALFLKIADELGAHAHQVKRVSLYRDGEPLLDKKLAQRVWMLKDRGIRRVAISTNVSLLHEEQAISLLQSGLDLIILSIDSLKKEVFERIRVRLNHEKVMANALRYIELRKRIRPSSQIWVRMIRQEGNYEEWPAFEAFWRAKLGPGDRVNYRNLHNWGGQLKDFRPVAGTTEPLLPCVALWSMMAIFADGRVPMCNADYKSRYPLGNVANSSIERIWHGTALAAHRGCHMRGSKSDIEICGSCNVWDEPPDRVHVAPQFISKTEKAGSVVKWPGSRSTSASNPEAGSV